MKPSRLLPLFAMLLSMEAQASSRMDLYDLNSGKLLYLGAIREQVTGGEYVRTTRICRPDGQLIIESETRLDAPTRSSGSFRQVDLRHGHENLLSLKENLVELSHRKDPSGELDTTTQKRPGSCIAPDDLSHFVSRHWKRIEEGKTVEPRLAVADEQTIVAFRLSKERIEKTPRGDVLVLRMEPSSWLYRRFVDPVFLQYEVAEPHRLVEFSGPSNYLDEEGEMQPLRIVFTPAPDGKLPCGAGKK